MKSYKELKKLKTFEERFEYLKLDGIVGEETFGYDRYLYQDFLHSKEWRRFRDKIVIRDNGCDLGILDREIQGRLLIHHMNPVSFRDVIDSNFKILMNPNNCICVSNNTHQAIHYSDDSLLIKGLIIRKPGDTKLW